MCTKHFIAYIRVHTPAHRRIGVNKRILSLFYKSTVESIISFCIINWFGSCTNIDKRKLKRIVKCAKRLGCDAVELEGLYRIAVTKNVN